MRFFHTWAAMNDGGLQPAESVAQAEAYATEEGVIYGYAG